jgi:hypothetical protein
MPRQNTVHTTFLLCWVLLSRPALILPARKPNGWYALSRNYAKNVQLVSHGRKWKKRDVGAVGEGGGWRSEGTKKRGSGGEKRGNWQISRPDHVLEKTRAGWRYMTRQQRTADLIAGSCCCPALQDVSSRKGDRQATDCHKRAAAWWWWWWWW